MRGPNPLVPEAGEPVYDAGGAWVRATRRGYDLLAVGALAAGPRGVRWLGRAGRLAQRWRLQAPDWRAVAALYRELDEARARDVAARLAGLRFLNRAAIALVQRQGLGSLLALLDPACRTPPRGLAARPRHGGLVLVAFHVGAHFGVGAALRCWGVDALTLRELPLEGAENRAAVLKRAVDHVRAGGAVLAVIDGPGGASTRPVTCLGRSIVMRRGPLALARATGAPVVPVVARWTPRGTIDAWMGEPLGSDRDEARLAACAAGWLEQHLRTHPDDLWPYTLANLLAAPPAAGGAAPLVAAVS